MGKGPQPLHERPISLGERKRGRLSSLLEKSSQYLKDFDYMREHDNIENAIDIAEEIVKDRNLSKLYIGEGAVFFKDPYIIPEALVEYTQADRASIIASILFASVRPVDGDAGNYLPAFDKAVTFAKSLHPKSEYEDLEDILQNALEIRALDIPVISRKFRTVDDLMERPSLREDDNNEYFRRMIVAQTRHKRALNIRLVQQLTKLEARTLTLDDLKTDEQRDELLRDLYATMHYYIPLAQKLGQQKLKEALEDHILRLADPDMHLKLTRYLSEYEHQLTLPHDKKHKGRYPIVPALCEEIKKIIEKTKLGVPIKVYGRRKTAFATWRKMYKKGITFSDIDKHIFDFVGITVEYDLSQHTGDNRAYRKKNLETGIDIFNRLRKAQLRGKSMLQIVKQPKKKGADPTTTPEAEKVEFRNYIKEPKRNGYSAIHIRWRCLFSIKGEEQSRMPIIDMHVVSTQDQRVNDFGIAAHDSYKASGGRSDKQSTRCKWGDAAEEIICCTPDGDYYPVKKKYCSAMDFAASIHNGLAAIAMMARVTRRNPFKINMKRDVAITATVENGDVIEIVKGSTDLLFDKERRDLVQMILGPSRASQIRAFYRKLDQVSGLEQ